MPSRAVAPPARDAGSRVRVVAGSVVAAALVAGAAITTNVMLAAAAVVAIAAVALLSRALLADVSAVLVVFLPLLFLFPQSLVLAGPLKSVGSPVTLVGLFCLVAWVAARVTRGASFSGDPRIRLALYVLLALFGVSLCVGFLRGPSPQEADSAIRATIRYAAFAGITLTALDGVTGRRRAEQITRILPPVLLLVAAIAFLEYRFPAFSWSEVATPPGFVTGGGEGHISIERQGFRRVHAAAVHPIEFAVALGASLPILMHHLSFAARRLAVISGIAIAGIALTVPTAISRAGLVTTALSVLLYAAFRGQGYVAKLLVAGAMGAVALASVIPGLLRANLRQITGMSADPSIAGRTEDYGITSELIRGHEVVGRGLGTFNPQTYFIIDNQFLGTLLETGIVGLAALFAFVLVALSVLWRTARRSDAPAARSFSAALLATLASLTVASVTFDVLSFSQTAFLFFLVAGLAGACSADPHPVADAGPRTG